MNLDFQPEADIPGATEHDRGELMKRLGVETSPGVLEALSELGSRKVLQDVLSLIDGVSHPGPYPESVQGILKDTSNALIKAASVGTLAIAEALIQTGHIGERYSAGREMGVTITEEELFELIGETHFALELARYDTALANRVVSIRAGQRAIDPDTEVRVREFMTKHLFADSTALDMTFLNETRDKNTLVETAYLRGVLRAFFGLYDEPHHIGLMKEWFRAFKIWLYHPDESLTDLKSGKITPEEGEVLETLEQVSRRATLKGSHEVQDKLEAIFANLDKSSQLEELEQILEAGEKISQADFEYIIENFPRGANWGKDKGLMELHKALKEYNVGSWSGENWEAIDRYILYLAVEAIGSVDDPEGLRETLPKMKSILSASRGWSGFVDGYKRDIERLLFKVLEAKIKESGER